jgi:hypothetical protein
VKKRTFPSDIVKYTQVEILSIPHLIREDDLPLQIKDADMRPIKRDTGLVPPSAPPVEDCRHLGSDLAAEWRD